MSRIYDAEKEAELEADIQTLEADISEASGKLQEFEGKPLEDDSQVAERNEAIARHTRLTNDHKVMSEKLSQMRLFKPAEKLPEAERDEELEALDAMLRSTESRGDKMDISLDKLVAHQARRGGDVMVSRSDQTGSAAGNAGGATEVRTQPTIVDSLKAYGVALNAIPIIETADGNSMNWPVTDNSSQEGEMLADEGVQITTADAAAVQTKVLNVKRFSSKMVPISNTLIQDSVFDITSYATTLCARRIGRTIGGKIVAAPLTDGIDGFKNIATELVIDSKAGFKVVDESVEMIHKIDRAYLSSEMGMGSNLAAGSGLNNVGGFVGFIVSRDAMRVLRTATDGEERPLWQVNTRVGEPGTIMGYPVMEVDELDAFGTQNNVPILFGNFTYMQGRFAKNITIERFYDSGTAAGDYTTYLGLARFGMRSILSDVGGKNPAIVAAKLPA